jgi:hypothetical protein
MAAKHLNHIRLVEDKYWFFVYKVDPVAGVSITLRRDDIQTQGGHYASIRLTLSGTPKLSCPDVTFEPGSWLDGVKKWFVPRRYPFLVDENGRVRYWASLSREALSRYMPEKGPETVDRLLRHEEAIGLGERNTDFSIKREIVQFQLRVRHHCGNGLTYTMEELEDRRDAIIEMMNPYALAKLFQLLVRVDI